MIDLKSEDIENKLKEQIIKLSHKSKKIFHLTSIFSQITSLFFYYCFLDLFKRLIKNLKNLNIYTRNTLVYLKPNKEAI